MLPGIDPQKLAQMQRVSQHVKGVIRVDYAEESVKLSLSSDEPEAQALIPQLLEQLSSALAQQLSSFFAIKGEIIESGKE